MDVKQGTHSADVNDSFQAPPITQTTGYTVFYTQNPGALSREGRILR